MKGSGEKHDKRHFINFTGETTNVSKRINMTTTCNSCFLGLLIILNQKYFNQHMNV